MIDSVVFKTWLQGKGAYEWYVENHDEDFMNQSLFEFEDVDKYRDAIGDAFLWDETQQGHRYWDDLCCEWEEYLDSREGV